MADFLQLKLEDLGEPLFQSRSSEVYDYDGGTKMLKVFRSFVDQYEIDNEEINTTEIYEKGASDVACYGQVRVEEPDGTTRSGIILKKVPGKTMIAFLGDDPTILLRASKIMAEKHAQLHAAESDKIRPYKDYVRHALEAPIFAEILTEEDRAEVERRLTALPDEKHIIHLDYHPDNIMTDGTNTTIIDFMTACTASPAADVAAVNVLLNHGEMIPSLSPAMKVAMNVVKKLICKGYTKHYKKLTGITDKEIDDWKFAFMIVRMGVWQIESEVEPFTKLLLEDLRK